MKVLFKKKEEAFKNAPSSIVINNELAQVNKYLGN